ncbi:MAG: hypothetical protein K2L31_07615 [Muribaculum sp.]|nr:hypothetical protein [Muribaculum sp.]MDE6458447.1 hypothetical protein [Muribaculum sp.]
MKVIRNNIIPFGRYGAINLFGVLFAKPTMTLTREVINHEKIHTRQMRELLYLPFYLLYVAEWCIRVIKNRGSLHRSYHEISFEQEAYRHGSDPDYLSRRKPFAQWRNHSTVQ